MSGPVTLPLTLLAAAGFLSSAGARVIDPLLHVIATDFGTTVPAVSIVVAAFTLPYGLCQLVLGPLGDRFGKLRLILVMLVCYALATAACALAGSLPALTLLRIGAGAASAALIPVSFAIIGDSVPYAERQVTLSRFLTGMVLAQLLAGPLGGVFGEYVGWRGVFLLLGAGALVVAAALGRRLRTWSDRRHAGTDLTLANYLMLARRPYSRRLLGLTFFDGMLLMGCFPFLAPYMHERFGLSYAAVGLVLSCAGLGALAYTRMAKLLVSRLGEARMMLAGTWLMAAALGAAVLTSHWSALVPAEIGMGMGAMLFHSVLQARATEMLPQARATGVAAFAFMLFLGCSVGALAIGALIDAVGYGGAFLLDAAAILALGGVAWLMPGRSAAA
ncbi:MFS transporter [Rhodovastum atsumiense]|uniref:MFS transporter n=1 Tax=Rhodovastum atsumiense TaxID=504468 RepID=UPI00139F2B7E|nr:MFS transporter [Rhodovastum atsumiense]CAH2600446.1 MFS transporter [Rhodovastum atsumiense]